MVADGLYDPAQGLSVPDVVLGQHVYTTKAGTVSIAPGSVLTAVDSFSIRVFGRGTHGTRPDLGIDPVLMASHIVVRLQSIVSRELRPGDVGVITVGSIAAGTVCNIIPEHANMKLTIRAFEPEIQERLVKAMRRVVQAECDAGRRRYVNLRVPMLITDLSTRSSWLDATTRIQHDHARSSHGERCCNHCNIGRCISTPFRRLTDANDTGSSVR